MKKGNSIEFIRTSTPGPYGIPLKVVDANDTEILFEVEIDEAIHTFSIKRSDVMNTIASPDMENLFLLDITPDSMARLYGKISAVVRSEKNQFIL
jgi:hypothetical protein